MTQPPPPGVRPHVQNGIDNSTVSGHVVQAGAIYGGVHYYNVNAPAPQPAAPAHWPVQVPHAPVPPRAGAGAIVTKWVLGLLPVFLCSVVIGGVADQIASRSNIGVRLSIAVVVLALGMAVTTVCAAVTNRGVADLLASLVDKVTPRQLAALSAQALIILFCCISTLWVAGLTTEVVERDPARHAGATGALVFLSLFAVLVGRLIARRRGPRTNRARASR
ncbi:hypothetical protein [Lentzea sp.]|uniref:hypothetical protein n=1 Tax=Lentzea sp. TaxID=56099 RepID=UPI002ED17BCF